MENLKEFRISLMQKDKEHVSKEEGKEGFIIKSSATFNLREYFNNHTKDKVEGEKLENFISTLSRFIYDELLDKCNHPIDSVGVWITTDDDNICENSMDINLLQKMEEYGEEDVNSIFELIKMTINQYESKTS